MHEAAVRASARSQGTVRRSGGRPTGRPRRTNGNRGGRSGGRPPSGLLPLIVLLVIVTVVSGIVMLLYRSGVESGPASQDPWQRTQPSPTATSDCPIPSTHSPGVIRTVYQVGQQRDVHPRVLLAAFEAGWVESHMRNLDCGDRDSLGVFQQRPSQGWGDREQVRDIRHAATRFFQVAEREHRRDPDRTAGQLAQSVQRSAFPQRYDEAEPKARELLAEARRLTSAGSR